MGEIFSSVTVFRLRDTLDGNPIRALTDFVDAEKKPTVHSLRHRYPFEAQLFVAPPESHNPRWVEPLVKGFGNLDDIPESVSNSAVMILEVEIGGKQAYYAFTFGFGRFLLLPGSVERNYGLRVALNAIYPSVGKREDFNRLRTVDSRTVAANTVRIRRQVDRYADFESFDVDIERDFLSGLTGIPLDDEKWGPRIVGSDSLQVTKSIKFNELGDLCRQIERHSKTVPRDFSWVEKIFAVRDSALIERLRNHVLDLIKTRNTSALELSPPELVEWGDIAHFAFSFASHDQFPEPSIERYVSTLESNRKLDSLSVTQLTSGHRLLAFDASGTTIQNWTVFRGLNCQIEIGRKTYVLSDSEFFEVAKDYLDELDRSISKLARFDGPLPTYNSADRDDYDEGAYNEEASASSRNYFLLDRQTVRLNSRTTPIEICDILTTGREMIHVKRKLSSSSLSHLFAQGVVSADLLLTNDDFRRASRRKIIGLERNRRTGSRFSRLFPEDRVIAPSDFTVVYAISAPWNGRRLADALPFFSKVNLRRCIRDLRRMGYKVAYTQIQNA